MAHSKVFSQKLEVLLYFDLNIFLYIFYFKLFFSEEMTAKP